MNFTSTKLFFKLTFAFVLFLGVFTVETYAAHPGKKQAVKSEISVSQVADHATLSAADDLIDHKAGNDTDPILLVVLAFLISPLAVYMYYNEWNKACTINLILWFLCGLPGIIHALIVILGKK